jgi:hypothetical protein
LHVAGPNEENNSYVMVSSQLRQEIECTGAGCVNVQEHEVRPLLANDAQAWVSIVCNYYITASLSKRVRENSRLIGIAHHQQELHCVGCPIAVAGAGGVAFSQMSTIALPAISMNVTRRVLSQGYAARHSR